MASRQIQDLRPEFQNLASEWLHVAYLEGLSLLVYCTLRTPAEQDELYKIGRTVAGAGATVWRRMGRTVTNAAAGQSAHNYGLALDFVPLNAGKPVWTEGPLYDRAIKIAESTGMESLRGNPKFSELAHLQMPNWRGHI